MSSVDASLHDLGTDYIDLLLVHWPRGGAPIEEQTDGLNRAVDAGKARYIGVSNYNAEMFRIASDFSRHPLITNQVEYHPFLNQATLLRQAVALNSSIMAYCGMAVGRVFQTELLQSIAARCGRTVSQIVLRWLIQQPQVVALSRTEKFERIDENVNIFDFELADDDMAEIGRLHGPSSRIVDPPNLAPAWD
jgi:2,5-diketo-D-gluconate reductase B